MNEIKIFENSEFGRVRSLMIDNEPYFVGKDVAEILGYAKPLNALANHIDEYDSLKQGLIDSMGRTQETIFINESGLYSLILSSKLPSAKKFKRWVTSEVLPSIRKTGEYKTTEPIKEMLAEAKLRNARAREASIWLKIGQNIKSEDYRQICSSYASEALAGSAVIPLPEVRETYYTATQLGDMLGISANRIGRIANEHKLKTSRFGKWYHDKGKNSSKEVDVFRYNSEGLEQIKKYI
ncbi:BRO family, N-terminal domain protein [Anaerofustis stercorihominis DSM 17244]|uniref:BRO family, N-terminal domain protein n=1 Tax=Anaerofustis stercorihominis DSM 17244 TaxID=445971 RepID=B1C7M5_9FIRM|nr:Bro-N domain-containing protein [Anaerofustis stercorihominis]EDS73012.1 BRO family, N-terminal domain protein [Anaerofustis stercorihominis DSM 17244]